VAGVAAGVVWALLAGYARRMAPERQQGRAIAIVMAGIPLALSLGVPAGTYLGSLLGWRATFSVMTVLALGLLGWIVAVVPDFPGTRTSRRPPLLRTLRVPGVTAVLVVTLVFVLAHTILYTYLATLLGHVGLGNAIDVVLLVFGIASMASIWFVGAHIDRRLRHLSIAGTTLVAVAAAILVVGAHAVVLVYLAVALWGLGWGGVPTLLQTAVTDAGGELADSAQAMLVTLWNVAMASGGILGGVLLSLLGPTSYPPVVLVLLVPVFAIVLIARRRSFPLARGVDS
jgi:predicted MFS family arabinose efflux permease